MSPADPQYFLPSPTPAYRASSYSCLHAKSTDRPVPSGPVLSVVAG